MPILIDEKYENFYIFPNNIYIYTVYMYTVKSFCTCVKTVLVKIFVLNF